MLLPCFQNSLPCAFPISHPYHSGNPCQYVNSSRVALCIYLQIQMHIFLFLLLHVNANMLYTVLYLFSLNSLSWKSFHISTKRASSFVFTALQLSILWMYHNLFNQSPGNGYFRLPNLLLSVNSQLRNLEPKSICIYKVGRNDQIALSRGVQLRFL